MKLAANLISALAIFLAACTATAAAPTSAADPMRRYVVDEPGALDAKFKRALEAMLIEHDRLTGEPVTFAIFNRAEGNPADSTHQAFTRWKTGHARENGVLLAVFWKERKSWLEAGYGLDALLTEEKVRALRKDLLEPELRNGSAPRAVGLAALELLTDLDSPLIESGKARELLRAGGFQGNFVSDASGRMSPLWFVLPLAGLIAFIAALMLLTSADAHFTGLGWYRPNPWWHYWHRFEELRRARSGQGGSGTPSALGGTDGRW